ncbi:MAG: hypothetical protein ACYSW3_28380 [Planctomycetota bacterium]
MEASKDLAERLRIRKTLTVASLKERLSASRKLREQQLLAKRKQQEQEEKPL